MILLSAQIIALINLKFKNSGKETILLKSNFNSVAPMKFHWDKCVNKMEIMKEILEKIDRNIHERVDDKYSQRGVWLVWLYLVKTNF